MLGYRGALVVDTLIQQAFDSAVSTDATCSIQLPDGTFMSRAAINTSVATIRGKNGRPFAGGRMRGIMHQQNGCIQNSAISVNILKFNLTKTVSYGIMSNIMKDKTEVRFS